MPYHTVADDVVIKNVLLERHEHTHYVANSVHWQQMNSSGFNGLMVSFIYIHCRFEPTLQERDKVSTANLFVFVKCR